MFLSWRGDGGEAQSGWQQRAPVPVILVGGTSQSPWHPPWLLQIRQECLACRGAAAVFDMSYFGKFYLVGVDAKKAADWLFSADVSRPPGTGPGRVMFLSGFSSRQNSWHSSGHWHEVAPLGSSSTCSAPWPGLAWAPVQIPVHLLPIPGPRAVGLPASLPPPSFLTPIPCCPGSLF